MFIDLSGAIRKGEFGERGEKEIIVGIVFSKSWKAMFYGEEGGGH